MIHFTVGPDGEAGTRWRRRATAVDDFLIGPENRLVGQVVAAIAGLSGDRGQESLPPSWLNPLVIVGAPGSGKSHLVRGLASLVAHASADCNRIVETTAADFAAQYVAAIGEDSLAELRERIRQARLWAVEDIGRLPSRRAVQAEYTQMLDELTRQGTLVVVTACRPPQQLTNLSAAIRSRLEAGLVLMLAPPGLEARREFLRRAAAAQQVPIEPTELDDLARRLPATPRQLLGEMQRRKVDHLTQAGAGSSPRGGRGASHASAAPAVDLANVVAVTARYFGVSQAAIKSASRRRSVVHARSVAMYLARELAGATLQEIGAVLGGRDHTTVMHACRKVDRCALQESVVQEELSDLRRLLLTV